jgi:hypothetical protein
VLRLSCRRLCTYLQCLDNFTNLIVCINVHGLTELNLLGNVALCWTVVWKIFPVVESLDPDKQVRVEMPKEIAPVGTTSIAPVGTTCDVTRRYPTLVYRCCVHLVCYRSLPLICRHSTQLLVNLRDMRGIMTGEVLDTGCSAVKARLGAALFTKMELGAYPFHRSCLVHRAYEIECTLCGGKEPTSSFLLLRSCSLPYTVLQGCGPKYIS